jgi:AraC family transcriptional regulator
LRISGVPGVPGAQRPKEAHVMLFAALHKRRIMEPLQRLECSGLKISCLDLSSAGVPLHDADDIRVLIPLAQHDSIHGSHAPGHDTVVNWPEVWIVPPRLGFALSAAPPARVAVVSIDRGFCEREAMAAMGVRTHVVDPHVSVDPVVRRFGNVFAAGMRVARAPEAPFLEGAARELAVHVAMNYGRPAANGGRGLSPDRLARAIRFIDASLGASLHVDDLARHVHMSPFHFARMFKISTGHSPHLYITLRRIERAKELLEQTSMALAEVAQAVGFATQAHFTGVFRAYTGTTPRVYRLRSRTPATA